MNHEMLPVEALLDKAVLLAIGMAVSFVVGREYRSRCVCGSCPPSSAAPQTVQ